MFENYNIAIYRKQYNQNHGVGNYIEGKIS